MPNLVTPILQDIENLEDIRTLTEFVVQNYGTTKESAALVVLSQLVVELVKQNRELSERVARLENTLAELENNA